jgi:hypothetical protein
MPTYPIEFTTDRGPQSLQFTLDDDRPLRSQINRIIEEIRHSGLDLRGRHDERLTIVWNGEELDAERTPRELKLRPDRAIELRMVAQRRKVQVTEPPVEPFLPKGGYAAALTGAGGALVAWLIMTFFDDLGRLIASLTSLDVAVATLLGGTIGMAVLYGDARRTGLAGMSWAIGGVGLGALGGVLGGALGVVVAQLLSRLEWQGFLIGRVLAWAALGAVVGLALGVRWIRDDRRRAIDGLGFGALAGAVGGASILLPGPADFWLVIAMMLEGAGAGYGVCGPALQRAEAILDLESVDGKPVRLFGVLEWVVENGREIPLTDDVVVAYEDGTCQVLAPPPTEGGSASVVTVAGRRADESTVIRNGDRLEVDGWCLRFRRRRSAAA